MVDAISTLDDIVAIATLQFIIAVTTEKLIVTSITPEGIIALLTFQEVDTVVAVVDEDNDPSRRDLIDAARAEASGVPAVMGVAVRSIEAWTLGAVTALAAELRTTATRLRSKYAAPVEQLYEGSQKPELRSKQLLKALADELAHRPDCLELREAVAAATDIDELCHHCPAGFARFVADLRAHFPARPTPAHPTPA